MDLFFDKEFREIIPSLQPNEFLQLENSLKAEGNREPIIIWREKRLLLDGHNRYDICHKYNIELKPPLELSFLNREDAQVWIIQNQFGRRNLSAYQRSVLALKLEAIEVSRSKQRMLSGKKLDPAQNSAQGETRDTLAKIANVSHDTIAKVKIIEKKATLEQREKLATGKATINQVFVSVKREEIKQVVKEAKWPEGKYRIIYADPPWAYSNTMPVGTSQPDDHYPLMTIEQLCKLPISELLEDNAVLFLWVTSPILEESFQVINAWGFKYKASFVWDKVKHNMGHYNSVRHEFLLVAVRGSCQPDIPKLLDSIVSIPRSKHSHKPEYFRKTIDELYPYGPRVELFATEKVEGWEAHGNKINT